MNVVASAEIVDPWLFVRLRDDPEISAAVGARISNGGALGPNATPFVTFELQSAADRTNSEGHTIWVECRYLVKVVGQGGSYEPLAPIARRVNYLLHPFEDTVGTSYISCRRELEIRYPELVSDVQYRHLGAIYHITTYTTT